ncbi:ABC transporter permease [Spiroplasma sp. SV19]|uniref:ABC transporter permease n=1 Tax=Spiroplasma sp. SV19 TaxID=2570468 RepID=UPI0024B742E0|nr:ABC transporter permease [Spiroplasma sp. SV19]WHQ36645.1 ABC transporter permease [Spiroplasma sp. SV19]
MKSNDIKILKIKPIKQGLRNNRHSSYQEPSLITKSHFFSGENSHFFNNGYFAIKPSVSEQIIEQNYLSPLTQCRELNLNLDNPDALRVLHTQAEKLEQEKTNFYQRLDKIKTTFDEKAPFHNDNHLQEPPIITNKVDLIHFNNNSPHRAISRDDRIDVDRAALKEQARAIAQKIMQKTAHKEPSKIIAPVEQDETISKPKSILTAHFPKITTVNPTPKKDIIVTQSYNNKTQNIASSSGKKSQLPFVSKINLIKEEMKFEQSSEPEQSVVKPVEKGMNIKVSTARGSEVYDELDVMEWDITKRPNLGLDHTTNKYYHQEETTVREEKIAPLPVLPKDDVETPRTIEIDEPVGSYRINNFYASLFDSPLPATKATNPVINAKMKRIRAKKQKKQENLNDENLNQEHQTNHVQPATVFSNSYKIQLLPNGRQRISKIKKNNIITWRNPIILTARIMAVVGLIILCSAFLIFNNWINNSSLDLYNFATITFGKFNFIQTNQDYLLANRVFMIIFLSIYAIIIILPFCVVSNFKIQLYLFLPFGLLFLGSFIGIALYGYFYKNNNFVLTSNIMQIISYGFLILANILMLIGILYLKLQKRPH